MKWRWARWRSFASRRIAELRRSNRCSPRAGGATLLFALIIASQNIAFAADAPTNPPRQSIGWLAKRGVAVCIDPSGYFISNVGLDRDRESLTITVPLQSASRNLSVISTGGNSSISIFRVEASDLVPLTVTASLPKLPVDVTATGYNSTPDGLVHTLSAKQAKVRQANTQRSFPIPSSTPDIELEGLSREEYPDGAALTDSQGHLIGLLLPGPSRQVRLFTASEVSTQVRAVIADQRRSDAVDAARVVLGPDFSHPAPPVPIPVHLSHAQASLAAVFAKNVPYSSTAVCIDPFGLYITILPITLSNENLFLARKDSNGHAMRMPAKVVSRDPRTGLTALLVDTPEPIPPAPLPQFPTPTGALYATRITCFSPDAYNSIQTSVEFSALRGRLRWHSDGSREEALLNREPFYPPVPAGAVFDDSGAVVGMTRFAVPPNAEDVALVSSRSTFPTRLVTFLTPTATTGTLTSPRDFYFHVHGLKPQDDPVIHLSLADSGTWRTYAAQRISSSEFVTHSVALASARVARVDYKVELLINNSVVDTRTGQVSVGGASSAIVAADNIRDLERNRTVSLPLPGLVQNPSIGGNGRYLIFRCTGGASPIAIFDVPAAKLRTLEINSSAPMLITTAGAEKLLVLDPHSRELRRFDLQTLRPEATSVLPEEQGLPQQMVIGSGSRGPAVISCQSGMHVIDLQTLQPLPGAIPPNIRRLQFLSASASGRVITGWAGPAGVNLLRWDGAKFSASVPATSLRPSEVFPDPDGERIYTGRGPILLPTQTSPRATDNRTEPWYPAADSSEFFFGASVAPGSRVLSATVYDAQAQRRILTIPLEEFKTVSAGSSFNRIIWLFAACGRLVVLPPGEQKIVIHPLTLPQQIGNYHGLLCFTSVPPRVAHAGETLNYKVQAVSAHDESLKFTLQHAPPDMQLDPEGQLTWAIPLAAKGTSVEVALSVKDATGTTANHKFIIYVE